MFVVNANTLATGTIFDSVGTILFNMAVNPTSGKVYVTNTESPNHVRFEGPGIHGSSTVQGHLSESRITILDPSGPSQDVQHLNQHIDYGVLHTDAGADHAAINGQIPHSLATPLQPTISSDGETIYVPAFGSSRIGVFTRAELEPGIRSQLRPGGTKCRLPGNGRRWAVRRRPRRGERQALRDDALQQRDRGDRPRLTRETWAVHPLHNPEPDSVAGRPFLYDANLTSGNGESSCASCHIFGDFDALAWNLGDPDVGMGINNQPQPDPLLEFAGPTQPFHPMKGPMTTQTLRGMSTHGGMHWRGDRVDGFFGTDSCTEPGYAQANATNAPCNEDLSFRNFIVAFEGLIGMEGTITPAEMQQFADFILQVQLPPNPVRSLDDSLRPNEQRGHDIWFSCGPGTTECAQLDANATDTVEDCDGCHTLDPVNGFFGTGGEAS